MGESSWNTYKHFCDTYEKLLSKITKENKYVIIGADQNIYLLKVKESRDTSDFVDTNFSSIVPTITRPTRVTHNTATLIDIFVSYNMIDRLK